MRKSSLMIRLALMFTVAIAVASAAGCGSKGDLVRPGSTAKAADRAPG